LLARRGAMRSFIWSRPPHLLYLQHDVRPWERQWRKGSQGVPQELLQGSPVQDLVAHLISAS